MPHVKVLAQWLYKEFGVASVWHTGRDAWFIILARTCRMFAYGANSLMLALFFSALKFTDFQIGLFMALTLLGDVLLSLYLSLVADRLGRRKILFYGAVLMVISGAIFAYFENFWILLVAAVVGVISISSDSGPFRSVEEAILSGITKPETRSDVLSWYVTISSLGSAAGTELSGRAVDFLQSRPGWTIVDAYHAIFVLYIIMGAANIAFAFFMSSNCELISAANPEPIRTEAMDHLLRDRESSDHEDNTDTLQNHQNETKSSSSSKIFAFTQISLATRRTMYKLWALLVADSTADGMVSYSLTNYYLDRKFSLSGSTLGDITSISYLLASLSTIFAGPLAKRLGLINTMVFTHIPSSTAVLFFPAPRSLVLTIILFFIRTGLNNMDQAPRTAFIAAVVRPDERTAIMGITSMLRTLASVIGPFITGILAGTDRFWIAFVGAGALRIAYDLGLWALFVGIDVSAIEEARKRETGGSRNGNGNGYALVSDEEAHIEMEERSSAGVVAP
ncbi:MAG: hypothetical protein GOMPHAMPRED_000122 [Gomphillus americanus]|uniref:Major facilitator superfamily (MFS) profile domain-containing protein n=1 Tax=Gomphillus americanus TaxID=1940652 RepID=A0A8H3I3I4_9LECA|nr:MAG: hypothetical protein GOMPHAMPRED_000122 [Gomphillus americanus]